MDPDKSAAIASLKPPETKTQLRRALGMFGWFKEYIPNFAKHTYVLTKLTTKQTPNKIPWGEKEQNAFDSLKQLLMQATESKLHAID